MFNYVSFCLYLEGYLHNNILGIVLSFSFIYAVIITFSSLLYCLQGEVRGVVLLLDGIRIPREDLLDDLVDLLLHHLLHLLSGFLLRICAILKDSPLTQIREIDGDVR